MKKILIQFLAIVMLVGLPFNAFASLIDVYFNGQVNEVIDRREPFLNALTPVGTMFSGSFQFHDTNNLWPNPGNYTTPNCIFTINFDTGFSTTIDYYMQTNILDMGDYSKLWLYGYTSDLGEYEEWWSFGIGFNFTVNETTGDIEWDYSMPQNVALSANFGGHYKGGPPEYINSAVWGEAYEIELKAVPIGSSVWLLGPSLVGLVTFRRRSKRN